ncbi:MAG: GNAT family N-acetyltransferase [Flavisolibacter sp.]
MIRQATQNDIADMSVIRMSVKENVLNNPALVQHKDYVEYLSSRGKGWVYETEGKIVGFAIADLKENNVWAVFIDPSFERRGIGKQLQGVMLDWYFSNTHKTIWLSTAPNSRAEGFYRKTGWKETGRTNSNEIRFEMSYEEWLTTDKGER